jgi:hypothetical protein
MLAGPAVIGPLTRFIPLNLTFFLPVVLCLAASGAARVIRPPVVVAAERVSGGIG